MSCIPNTKGLYFGWTLNDSENTVTNFPDLRSMLPKNILADSALKNKITVFDNSF